MAIPTTRAKEKASILIDYNKCTVCGKCVEVCKDFSIEIREGKLVISDNPLFGCIGCGHCMAVCPTGAIEIKGREISPADIYPLPDSSAACGYEQLSALLERRRSIREFSEKGVSADVIEKILNAARTSPMGLPPSDVNVLVLGSREAVRGFGLDFCNYLNEMKWFVSRWFLGLMRPLWGKANDEMFRGFVKPMFNFFIKESSRGVNMATYDAPLAMYFYGSPYTDPADPIIAATVAMYAAESLGLGTCMIGSVHPLIQNGKKAKQFREKYKIKYTSREGLIVLFGYPAVKYKKGIRRTFASEVHL
ncbi:MAG: nitroreductase family protein [Bacteroidales bacterium]|jgi:ferredoxin|nr:nitroreductase family protein [Bacteroidales bacterium]